MTYQFINQSRILQFLETLIVSHTYRFKECFKSFKKPLIKGFIASGAKNKVHNAVNKSTQVNELGKNSQKRLCISQKRLLPKGCYFPSFFQQASLTHSEKGCSFLSVSIFSTKSSSKRICFLVEPERSNDFFSFFTCMVRTTVLYLVTVRTNIQQDDDLA